MAQPRQIDGLFPVDLANDLLAELERGRWSHGWRSNSAMGYGHWNIDLARGETWNGLDVSARLQDPFARAWQFIRANVLPGHRLIRCYANAHTYGVEGYPHTDSIRPEDITIVAYMNRTWKREWAGETVIFEGDNTVLAQLPAFNRALIFSGADLHCARGVTRICPELRRTLMFKCAPEDCDPHRDALQVLLNQVGAFRKGHMNGNLGRHLLITYDLLRKAGQPAGVCLAGGAHSVFGTNAFKDPCLDPADRPMLVEVIGEEAVRLVEIFGAIARPGTLDANVGKDGAFLEYTTGGGVAVTKLQLDALCMIECANLLEQSQLARWQNLNNLWQQKVGRNDLSLSSY